MSGVWHGNMTELRRARPELYRMLAGRGLAASAPPGSRFPSVPVGHLQAIDEDFAGLLVFVGIGDAGEIMEILAARPGIRMLVVVEPLAEAFAAALAGSDLRPLILDERVRFFVGDFDPDEFGGAVARVASQEDIHVRRHVPSFESAHDIYSDIDRRVFLVLNDCNTAGGTTRRNGGQFFRNRMANLALARHSRSVEDLAGVFRGRPALVVAAGPSLDRELAVLPRAAGRAVVLAVDSALVPLVRAGLTPDFVTSIDYQAPNFEKVAGLLDRQWPFSLIASLSVTPLIPGRLRCRRLFWAFDDDQPQQWVSRALGVGKTLPVGSSVAHLALTAAVLMGCEPIALVGQDLAYTGGNSDHASDTVISAAGPPPDREIFQVPGVGGGTVGTDRLFIQIKKEIEEVIADSGRMVVNTSAVGARIAGAEEMPLAGFIDSLPREGFSVREIEDAAVAGAGGLRVERLVEAGERIIVSCGKMSRLASESRRLGSEAVERIARMGRKHARPEGFDSLPGRLREILTALDRINRELDSMVEPSEQIMELTFAELRENDRARERNQRLREDEGFLAWLVAEIERVGAVNAAREDGCGMCAELLGELCSFLRQEKSLLAGAGADLARAYVGHGLYALAAGIARDGGEGWSLVEAECALARFDMKDVRGGERDEVRRRHLEFWTDVVVSHARYDGEIGDFPTLLPVWLERISAMLAGDDVPGGLRTVWRRFFLRCRQLMDEGRFPEVAAMTGAWNPVADRMDAVRILTAENRLRSGTEARVRLDGAAPGDADRDAALAMYAIAAGDPVRGLDLLARAVAAEPAWGVLWAEVGDILARAGDHEGAAAAFERGFLALPSETSMLERLGDCHAAMGRVEAARAAYEAVLARDPDAAQARAALAALA